MSKFQLATDVYVETIALKVNDVEKMNHFYKNILGFVLKVEENNMSIFGSEESNSRLLILEEIETAEKVVGTFKQIFCFSLLIPTEAEFSALLKKITMYDYPIGQVLQEKNRRSVILSDPEGNKVELCYYVPKTAQHFNQQETFDPEEVLAETSEIFASLSPAVRIERLRMPVENSEQYHFFYQGILGMPVVSEKSGRARFTNGRFSLELIEVATEPLSFEENEETLGIEFLIFPLKNKQEMEQLKEHLDNEKQSFFVDKKRTVLTIYDPGNTEWWFVNNE